MSHRHRSRTALICFLLCIPLAFIAYLGIIYYTDGINAGEVTSVEVSVPGKDITEYTDKENISFFVDMFQNATGLSAPLRVPDESTCITVRCVGSVRTQTYKIYPELSQTGCMFTASDGKYYLITPGDAEILLSRDELDYMYTEVFLPFMYIVTGQLQTEVTPDFYEWQYKKQNGKYIEYTGKEVTDVQNEKAVYSIYSDRINSIHFTRDPDDITVVISDTNGNLIGQTDFNSLIFGRDTRLTVTVEASWKLTGDSKCNGSASYSFDVIYDIPAEISFSSEEAEIGGYVTVNVKYLNDGETVTLNSALNTGELYFTENDGVKTAVLGISDDNLPGDYDIAYSIGDNGGSVKLTVTGIPQNERSDIYRLNISETDYQAKLGENAANEFETIQNMIFDLLGDVTYSHINDFTSPASNTPPALGYGVRIIVNIDNSVETQLFYSIGNSYDVIENSKVTAAADGKVIYAGQSCTFGNLMVIDHGCGVCTWYYGLSSMERGAGTVVQKGSIIGFAGISSYTDNASLGFCVSAGREFIKPPTE